MAKQYFAAAVAVVADDAVGWTIEEVAFFDIEIVLLDLALRASKGLHDGGGKRKKTPTFNRPVRGGSRRSPAQLGRLLEAPRLRAGTIKRRFDVNGGRRVVVVEEVV